MGNEIVSLLDVARTLGAMLIVAFAPLPYLVAGIILGRKADERKPATWLPGIIWALFAWFLATSVVFSVQAWGVGR